MHQNDEQLPADNCQQSKGIKTSPRLLAGLPPVLRQLLPLLLLHELHQRALRAPLQLLQLLCHVPPQVPVRLLGRHVQDGVPLLAGQPGATDLNVLQNGKRLHAATWCCLAIVRGGQQALLGREESSCIMEGPAVHMLHTCPCTSCTTLGSATGSTYSGACAASIVWCSIFLSFTV